MKKICFISLSLFLAVSIFAQQEIEVNHKIEKNEIHARYDTRKDKGFDSIMQISLLMGNKQLTDRTTYTMPGNTYVPSVTSNTTYYYPYTSISLTVAPSFTITNGYRFDKHWAAGVGVGFEIFDRNLFPLFAEIRYTLWDDKISPFVVVKGGYSFGSFNSTHHDNLYLNWSPYYVNDARLRNYGGIMFNPEIGVKLPLNGNCDLMISAAYRYQKTKSVVRKNYDETQFDEWEHKDDINRLSFSVAIMFM